MPKPTATTTEATEKPKRIQRASTPFDEARKAQEKLEGIELKRRAVIDALSDEAAAMLEALEELRAKQSIDVAPSSPRRGRAGPRSQQVAPPAAREPRKARRVTGPGIYQGDEAMKELKLWSKFTTEWSAVGQHAASHQRLYGCLNDRGERCFWIDTPGSGPTAENAVPPNLACSSRVPAGYVLYPEAPAEEPKRQTLAEKLASRHDTPPPSPPVAPPPAARAYG
jgi:hypothetical protein